MNNDINDMFWIFIIYTLVLYCFNVLLLDRSNISQDFKIQNDMHLNPNDVQHRHSVLELLIIVLLGTVL